MVTKTKKTVPRQDGVYNRAVIYARYSPGPNQRDESIEGQIRECKDVAKRHGLMVIHEYIDKRMTGTNDDRPDFQRMLRDADRGLFDVVIVWKNDRFARNRYDSAIYKQRLKRNGIKILYAKEHIPDGPEGIILESVLEGMAEYYSANLAQNIRRGQRENALEGKFVGGTVPLGYKLDAEKRYVLDKEKSPLVLEIFERYVAGEAVIDICNDLNARGYLTARKRKFNRSSLHRILANEKYTGLYRFEDIETPGAVPRIISDELFQAAAVRAARNKKHRRTMQEERVEFINTFLWTFDDQAFIPHGSKKDGFGEMQPIWISANDDTPNEATMLFLVDGAKVEVDYVQQFERVFNIFDGNSETAVNEARVFWKALKTAGIEIYYWQQESNGRWQQKA